MFKRNPQIVVAIKTNDLDALRISVPPLRRFARKFSLIIFNANSENKLTRRMVRKVFPRGAVHIINSEQSVGELESILKITEFVQHKNISCDWIMFLDDNDVLIDFWTPNVGNNVFAVVQNATTISESVTDIFKISPNWARGAPIGKTEPRFAINGTMIRGNIMFEFMEFMRDMIPQTLRIINKTRYYVPISTMLWAGINAFMRIRHPNMSPIYMNRTNCVIVNLGHSTTIYGQTIPNTAAAHKMVTSVINQFAEMIENTAKQNMVAENL